MVAGACGPHATPLWGHQLDSPGLTQIYGCLPDYSACFLILLSQFLLLQYPGADFTLSNENEIWV